ncbi:hypothetical protein ABH935_002445 [Catenulispora sp. GAS73]
MAVPGSGTAIGVSGVCGVSDTFSAFGASAGGGHQANPRRVARNRPSDLPRSAPRMAVSSVCLSRPSPPC